MSAYSPRIAFVTALICVGLLSAAFYLEFISGLVPCALCLAQRAMFALIGIACLLYLLPFYGSRLIFGLISFSLAQASVSGWHLDSFGCNPFQRISCQRVGLTSISFLSVSPFSMASK